MFLFNVREGVGGWYHWNGDDNRLIVGKNHFKFYGDMEQLIGKWWDGRKSSDGMVSFHFSFSLWYALRHPHLLSCGCENPYT